MSLAAAKFSAEVTGGLSRALCLEALSSMKRKGFKGLNSLFLFTSSRSQTFEVDSRSFEKSESTGANTVSRPRRPPLKAPRAPRHV